jgi:hypothetical protein
MEAYLQLQLGQKSGESSAKLNSATPHHRDDPLLVLDEATHWWRYKLDRSPEVSVALLRDARPLPK